jgi:hypothetical protein
MAGVLAGDPVDVLERPLGDELGVSADLEVPRAVSRAPHLSRPVQRERPRETASGLATFLRSSGPRGYYERGPREVKGADSA